MTIRSYLSQPRTGEKHDPTAVSEVPTETLVNGSCVEQRVDIVVAGPGADIEEVFCWIDVRLGLVKPDIVEAVRLDVAISNGLPPPLVGIWIRCIYVRPDLFGEMPGIRCAVGGVDEPSLSSAACHRIVFLERNAATRSTVS